MVEYIRQRRRVLLRAVWSVVLVHRRDAIDNRYGQLVANVVAKSGLGSNAAFKGGASVETQQFSRYGERVWSLVDVVHLNYPPSHFWFVFHWELV